VKKIGEDNLTDAFVKVVEKIETFRNAVATLTS
jgi:hypothetical protein